MRNLRKLTAAVLAIAIVLTSMTAVFAADTTTTSTVVNGDKAVTLKDLGLYAGQDPNDPKIGLEDALTTQDSLIFLAKLFGYFDAANKLTADEVAEALAKFDDADSISDYAKNVVAYSAANGILSGSTSNGKFFVGAKDTVTAARFATFMLKQMGYTVPKYTQSVAQIAAIDGSKVSATLAGDLIRDDAVGAMYGVLPAKKANGTTVIADIVGTDAALKAIAEKAGLIAVEGLVKNVSAVTTTKVLVTLAKKVDSAAAVNFAIAGATVNGASLSNGTDVVLTTSVLAPLKEYTLTVSGLKTDAVENASVTKTFVVPDINKLYSPTLTADKTVLKADGASSTLVTFSLKDAEGKTIEDAQDVEVAFTTTFGNFGEKRVSVQKGVATVMLTSEFLEADKTADLTAVVVEAKDTNLIGLKASFSVIMSPNPDSVSTETLGASMVAAEANQADRITLYFNKEVDVANFVYPSTNALKGQVDPLKATIVVKEGITSDNALVPALGVRGILPVAGNKKALQVLLNVEADINNALTDNNNVFVSFTDLTGSVAVQRSLSFKLTDARKPSMLGVSNDGSLRKLNITFSEPVDSITAPALANWSIDGILLSNTAAWGNATVTVGAFDVATATDKRSVVTITLGAGKYFTTGAHSVQAANVGDWAWITDWANNVMNTQTLDFVIPVDNSQPSATVEVQSPEQWLVTFNRDVAETAADFQADLKLQRLDTNGSWVDDTLPLSVTKIDDNKFLVETCVDWTIAHNTLGTLKNYFNFNYQLKIAKDAVTNVANGLKNSEQVLTLGGAMLAPDTTSPVISDIVEVTAGTAYKAVMSEPVKMGLANNEGQTSAQAQATTLPVVTADFIKADFSKTVAGTIGVSFADNYDKELSVTPASALEPGKWILVIRSISDDIGNTAASVTKEFTVAGTVTSTAFKALWSFADVDTDLVIEPTDLTGDNDSTYDYVYVKFNKAVSVSGDFKNALKTANYTLDGSALPLGTQILANIAGYDDLDAVIDSVTIRLPEGTLGINNTPHVLNISTNLESTTAGEKLTNGGEIVLPSAIALTDYLQFTADLATRDLVNAVNTAKTACTTTTATGSAINIGNIPAFVTAYNAAKASIDAAVVSTTATSYVKAQYLAAINSYKAAVASLTGFTNTLTGTVGATSQLTFTVGTAPSAGFTATSSNPYVATVTNTGLITPVANGTTVITVVDTFWGVTKTVTVTVAGGAITIVA